MDIIRLQDILEFLIECTKMNIDLDKVSASMFLKHAINQLTSELENAK